MLTETQDEVYFARMRSALGDKSRIVDFVKPGTVLDVGAGGGELSEVIRQAGNEVFDLDGSSEAIKHIQEDFPKIHALLGLTENARELFSDETFDTIVCSSVLHEVYSYGNTNGNKMSLETVIETLNDFFKLLKPGGVLIIRDGVMPTQWDKDVIVRLKTQDAIDFLEMYREKAPFYSETRQIRKVSLSELSPGVYKGNLASAMEFLYTLTWGWNSAPRETQELYGIFTEEGYCRTLEMLGFEVEHSEQYLQSGYPEHLNPVADILDHTFGETLPLPSSNMIIAARRPSKEE